MPDLEQLSQGHVIRVLAQGDRLAFALFLGAGTSKSSGVPLASDMVNEWKPIAHQERAPDLDYKTWCAQNPWLDGPESYSRLFEMLYLDPPSRQKYIETKIKDAFPGWGYLYLANIVGHGRFNVMFTTNFDDLINDALTIFLGYNPVVCAADSEVTSINITTDRAKIIKLHGDYLFQSLKNTIQELRHLGPNMEHKFREFASQCGLVVIGYSGFDQSIMGVLDELLKDRRTFPNGIYWGVRTGEDLAKKERVRKLATDYPRRFHLFQCPDFDLFMARLHDALRTAGPDGKPEPLKLPAAILQPYQALKARYQRLLTSTSGDAAKDPTIQAHMQKLSQELDREWAKANPEDFDLLQAQIALGRRDYKKALPLITAFVFKRPASANGMATWGDALAIRAEEESSDAFFEEAAAKWKQAILIDPTALPPRYSLARYLARKQQTAEGIAVCEELLRLVPNDAGLRRNLAQLYGAASRYDDAQRQIDWLLQREPKNAELHAMRASLFEQQGLVPEAIEEIRAAASLAPQNPWYHFALANSLAKTNRADEAGAEYEHAIRLDPRNLNFRIQIATFYTVRQQVPLALPHLQTAVTIGPQSAEARGWLCQTWLALGNFAAAQTEGEAAVRLSRRDSRIRVTLGMAYLQGNRPDLAEPHLKTATELNPGAPDAFAALCWLYRMQNRPAELNTAMQQLARLAPQIAQMLQMQFQTQPAPWTAGAGAPNPAAQNFWQTLAQGRLPQPPVPPPLPGSPGAHDPTMRNLADKWQKFLGGN